MPLVVALTLVMFGESGLAWPFPVERIVTAGEFPGTEPVIFGEGLCNTDCLPVRASHNVIATAMPAKMIVSNCQFNFCLELLILLSSDA